MAFVMALWLLRDTLKLEKYKIDVIKFIAIDFLQDKYNLSIIRLFSLWFEKFHEEDINGLLKDALNKIESRKFLPVIYQVAARLGTAMTSQSSSFKINIEQVGTKFLFFLRKAYFPKIKIREFKVISNKYC